MSPRFRLVISYLGTRFHGWQIQENAQTVQGCIEDGLHRVFGMENLRLFASGRTDAGVHAAGQVAHLDLPLRIPPGALLRALNSSLPEDIRILRAARTSPDFHARYDARAKIYVYRLRWSSAPLVPPWRLQRVALLPKPRRLHTLLDCLPLLEGLHDFASFSVRDPKILGRSSRRIFSAGVALTASGLRLEFKGNGFLRYQVRRMTGALLEVACGRQDAAWFEDLLENPRPGAAVITAPARGLCLEKVLYARRGSDRLVPDSGGGG